MACMSRSDIEDIIKNKRCSLHLVAKCLVVGTIAGSTRKDSILFQGAKG
jgi:hypothetical protein